MEFCKLNITQSSGILNSMPKLCLYNIICLYGKNPIYTIGPIHFPSDEYHPYGPKKYYYINLVPIILVNWWFTSQSVIASPFLIRYLKHVSLASFVVKSISHRKPHVHQPTVLNGGFKLLTLIMILHTPKIRIIILSYLIHGVKLHIGIPRNKI